jgi:hypothetical protein
MYLIFDCSTIEKPLDYKAPFSESSKWPKVIHVSWILLDSDYKPIEDYDCVINPEGYKLTKKILNRAKLEEEDITRKGADAATVLTQFNESVDKCQYIFSHNLSFNENVLAAEYIRNTIKINMFQKERFCLMEEATYFCKIPSRRGGYKWPSLTELHAICFKKVFTPPNNARADVIATARCFIKLMKTGQLEDLFDDE